MKKYVIGVLCLVFFVGAGCQNGNQYNSKNIKGNEYMDIMDVDEDGI